MKNKSNLKSLLPWGGGGVKEKNVCVTGCIILLVKKFFSPFFSI